MASSKPKEIKNVAASKATLVGTTSQSLSSKQFSHFSKYQECDWSLHSQRSSYCITQRSFNCITHQKTPNPTIIELLGNDDNSSVTNSSNLSGTSTKPPGEVSKDSVDKHPLNNVVIIPLKPDNGLTDSDTDMRGGDHDTGTNPSDYNCNMLTHLS